MFWLFLYVYTIGTLNDIMFAMSNDADFKDWRVHVSIAFWPITVPIALVAAFTEKDKP
jgi:hypothetical protein